MPIAFVQAAQNGTNGATANSLAATISAGGTGNFIVGVCTWGSATTGDLTSITDGTNSYTIKRRIADTDNSQSAAIFYAYNISGSPTTITMNLGTSLGWRGISVAEFSGVKTTDPIDGTNEQGQWQTAPGTGTDGIKSGAGTQTPSENNCLVFGGSVMSGAGADGASHFTAGTNFTEPGSAEHVTSGDMSLTNEYWIQTTATAANASFTGDISDDHITFQAIFLSPSGGGGGGSGTVFTTLRNELLRTFRPRPFAPGRGR